MASTSSLSDGGPSGAPRAPARPWLPPEAPAEPSPRSAALGPGRTDPLPADGSGPDEAEDRSRPPRLPVPLRPMTVADVLDGAFGILKARPRQVLGITAAVVVPVQLVAAYLQDGLFDSFEAVTAALGGTSAAASGWAVVRGYLGVALALLSLWFVGGAIGRLVSAWYAGGDLTAGQALRATFARSGALVAAFALVLPVKVASVCFFLLPSLVVVPLLSLAAPAIVIEGLGPVAGIQRSVSLAWRRVFPVVGIVLLATLVEQLVRGVLNLGPEALGSALSEVGFGWAWVVTGAGRALVTLITVPFLVGVSVLLYVDLRVRTEGLDLELEAADAFPA